MVPRTTAAPRAATGPRVRARRPRSRLIAERDGGAAVRPYRPAHGSWEETVAGNARTPRSPS